MARAKRWRGSLFSGLLLCLTAAPPPAQAAGDDGRTEVPFPAGKTAILKEEKAVYTVEGRVRIPKGVSVTCLRDVHIVGKGATAVIEVEGSLSVHGVQTREVIFEGVTIEPQAKFSQIHMDQTIFRKGGGVRTPTGRPCAGYMLLELMDFTDGAQLDVTLNDGSVELSSVCSDDPVGLHAVDLDKEKTNTVRFEVRGCVQNPRFPCQPHGGRVGLRGGLTAEGGQQMVVRLSRLGGALTAARDWSESLIFDGNKVDSKVLEFRHRDRDKMQKAQLFKCDVYSESVTFSSPPPQRPGQTDEVPVERFWFKGLTDPKEIFAKVVKDGRAEPEKNAARVKLLKVNDRALELAGPLDR